MAASGLSVASLGAGRFCRALRSPGSCAKRSSDRNFCSRAKMATRSSLSAAVAVAAAVAVDSWPDRRERACSCRVPANVRRGGRGTLLISDQNSSSSSSSSNAVATGRQRQKHTLGLQRGEA